MSEVVILRDGLHSELGPSAAERWLNCPGSVLASRGVHSPQKEYAAEGVAAHSLSEWARQEGKPVSHWKGTVIKVDEFEFKVGKAFIEGVQKFVDACAAVPGDPQYETMVHYQQIVPDGFGTLDDARLRSGLGVVTDLKYGKGVKVFAKDNPQLMLYALGLFFQWDWLYGFQKFVMRINQPRLNHYEEDEIKVGQLLEWAYDYVRPKAALTQEEGAPIRAGGWCKFCKIKATCTARAQYKQEWESAGRGTRTAESEFVNMDTT